MNINQPGLTTNRSLPTITLLVLGTTLAWAHPGHGLTDASPAHLITSPDHFAVLLVSGGILFYIAQLVQRRLPRRWLQSAGALALVGAAVIRGLHL